MVVCPDDTHIIEENYDGYGNFDGKDIYELVVDWNKPYLEKIFEEIEEYIEPWEKPLIPIAIAYMNDDERLLQKELEKAKQDFPYIERDWKRDIGIAIACEDKCAEIIPYPIKIVKNIRTLPYAELGISYSCQ